MSEKDLEIPAVTESSNNEWIQAGVHATKIVDIVQAKVDKNGFPGHEYTFENREKKIMKKVFYFNDKPSDPNRKCLAEWVYAKLKSAIGIPAGETKKRSEIVGLKLYICVKKTEVVDKDGEPILNKNGNPTIYNELIPEFYPYVKGASKPVLDGDPEHNNGVPKGKFYEKKIETKKVTAVKSNNDDFVGAPTTQQPSKETPVASEDF